MARERGFDETGQPVAYWAASLSRPVKTPQSETISRATEGTQHGAREREPLRLRDCAADPWSPCSPGQQGEPAAVPSASGRPGVSLEAEVPEALFDGMREFLRHHPQWNPYTLMTSALAGFLFQNGVRETCVKDHYLGGLFPDT